MTDDVTLDGPDGHDAGLRARNDFLDFLNDVRPPMFVEESLTWLLRTAPPYHVQASDVAELIAAWGEERARLSHQPRSVYFLNALRRIVTAHNANAIRDFDPDMFLVAVGPNLSSLCPSSEVGGLHAGIRDLRASLSRPLAAEPSSAAGDDTIEIQGNRYPIKVGQEMAIARLEHEAYMTDDVFEEVYRDVHAALTTRVGIPVNTALQRISRAAASIFNTGRVPQALRLFTFVDESLDRLKVSPEGRQEVQAAVRETDINEGLLAKVLQDSEKRSAAAPMVRTLGYLNPFDALLVLAEEKRRDRRRLFLNAFEVYGADAMPLLVDRLAPSVVSAQPWYLTRNLLYLLSRIDAPDDATRKRAIEAAGRFVTSDQPQLRTASLAALKHQGGRECVPYVVRAVDPSAYPAGSIDDTEALKRHLFQSMDLLMDSGNETAISIVAELATGHRGAEFDLGAALRDEACVALSRRKAPLPRRAALVIANHLSGQIGKRFKFVTGNFSLGIDAHACKQLSALIADSPEPEAKDVLAHPMMQRFLE
jgi:hypothetical protein